MTSLGIDAWKIPFQAPMWARLLLI